MSESMTNESIAFTVKLNEDYTQAVETVTAALKAEGFGVLTSVDVKATLKEKIDVDFRRYTILGACNPPLAHRALSAEALVGLMLPCNVTVEETEDGGALVNVLNPRAMMAGNELLSANEDIQGVGEEAYEKLKRVAESLG